MSRFRADHVDGSSLAEFRNLLEKDKEKFEKLMKEDYKLKLGKVNVLEMALLSLPKTKKSSICVLL